jgi:hypothetical protein
MRMGRRSRRHQVRLATFGALLWVVCSAAFATTAAAGEPIRCGGTRITPAAGLKINGILNVAGTFTGTLRVHAVGKAAEPAQGGNGPGQGGKKSAKPPEIQPPFFIRDGDLVATGSTEHRIAADDIKITNVTGPLKKGQSREVEVTIEGARFVGEYTGAIRAGNGHCEVPLTVVVAGPADLSLVESGSTTALSVQVVSCGGFSCGPNENFEDLTRSSARRDDFAPQVSNGSQSPAEIMAVQVALNRNPGGQLPPLGAIKSTRQAFTRPPLRVSRLESIAIDRDEIDPGHYTGAVYLTLRGAEKRVALPLELDVKSGPFWAIVVLLAALFVQFLVWLAGRNKPRGEELRELREAERRIRTELDPEDLALLEGRFKTARDLARRGKLTEAKTTRTALEEEAKWLPEVRAWIGEIKKSHDGQLPDRVRELELDFRRAIEHGNRGEANSARTDLRDARSPEKVQRDKLQAEALDENVAFDAKQPSPPQPGPLVRFAIWIEAGLRRLWNAIIHPLRTLSLFSIYGIPWLLRALLVFAFVLAGLKELYFDNSTFGVDPVLSYSALFIWGLTATAVNTALGKVIPVAAS